MTQIPAPVLFAEDVPAWQALASRLRGRLELGRMWIHEGQVGTSAVEIGSVWARAAFISGAPCTSRSIRRSRRRPLLPKTPSLSPAARDTWRELATRSKSVRIDPSSITVELEGKLADPQVAMPIVELAVTLRQALSGAIVAGPFR